MERIPSELLYILLFLGFILFNYVMRQARRRQQEKEEQAAAQAAPRPAEDEPLEEIWGRPPARAPAAAPGGVPRQAPLPAAAASPAPRRRHSVRALLKDKHDLRRAIVLTTVLGPCRAQEPEQR